MPILQQPESGFDRFAAIGRAPANGVSRIGSGIGNVGNAGGAWAPPKAGPHIGAAFAEHPNAPVPNTPMVDPAVPIDDGAGGGLQAAHSGINDTYPGMRDAVLGQDAPAPTSFSGGHALGSAGVGALGGAALGGALAGRRGAIGGGIGGALGAGAGSLIGQATGLGGTAGAALGGLGGAGLGTGIAHMTRPEDRVNEAVEALRESWMREEILPIQETTSASRILSLMRTKLRGKASAKAEAAKQATAAKDKAKSAKTAAVIRHYETASKPLSDEHAEILRRQALVNNPGSADIRASFLSPAHDELVRMYGGRHELAHAQIKRYGGDVEAALKAAHSPKATQIAPGKRAPETQVRTEAPYPIEQEHDVSLAFDGPTPPQSLDVPFASADKDKEPARQTPKTAVQTPPKTAVKPAPGTQAKEQAPNNAPEPEVHTTPKQAAQAAQAAEAPAEKATEKPAEQQAEKPAEQPVGKTFGRARRAAAKTEKTKPEKSWGYTPAVVAGTAGAGIGLGAGYAMGRSRDNEEAVKEAVEMLKEHWLAEELKTGKSDAAFSHNVKTEMNAGKPQKQAVAIAYAKKREAEAKEAVAIMAEALGEQWRRPVSEGYLGALGGGTLGMIGGGTLGAIGGPLGVAAGAGLGGVMGAGAGHLAQKHAGALGMGTVGAGVGAGLGALAGHATEMGAGHGALIGAGLGGTGGALAGHKAFDESVQSTPEALRESWAAPIQEGWKGAAGGAFLGGGGPWGAAGAAGGHALGSYVGLPKTGAAIGAGLASGPLAPTAAIGAYSGDYLGGDDSSDPEEAYHHSLARGGDVHWRSQAPARVYEAIEALKESWQQPHGHVTSVREDMLDKYEQFTNTRPGILAEMGAGFIPFGGTVTEVPHIVNSFRHGKVLSGLGHTAGAALGALPGGGTAVHAAKMLGSTALGMAGDAAQDAHDAPKLPKPPKLHESVGYGLLESPQAEQARARIKKTVQKAREKGTAPSRFQNVRKGAKKYGERMAIDPDTIRAPQDTGRFGKFGAALSGGVDVGADKVGRAVTGIGGTIATKGANKAEEYFGPAAGRAVERVGDFIVKNKYATAGAAGLGAAAAGHAAYKAIRGDETEEAVASVPEAGGGLLRSAANRLKSGVQKVGNYIARRGRGLQSQGAKDAAYKAAADLGSKIETNAAQKFGLDYTKKLSDTNIMNAGAATARRAMDNYASSGALEKARNFVGRNVAHAGQWAEKNPYSAAGLTAIAAPGLLATGGALVGSAYDAIRGKPQEQQQEAVDPKTEIKRLREEEGLTQAAAESRLCRMAAEAYGAAVLNEGEAAPSEQPRLRQAARDTDSYMRAHSFGHAMGRAGHPPHANPYPEGTAGHKGFAHGHADATRAPVKEGVWDKTQQYADLGIRAMTTPKKSLLHGDVLGEAVRSFQRGCQEDMLMHTSKYTAREDEYEPTERDTGDERDEAEKNLARDKHDKEETEEALPNVRAGQVGRPTPHVTSAPARPAHAMAAGARAIDSRGNKIYGSGELATAKYLTAREASGDDKGFVRRQFDKGREYLAKRPITKALAQSAALGSVGAIAGRGTVHALNRVVGDPTDAQLDQLTQSVEKLADKMGRRRRPASEARGALEATPQINVDAEGPDLSMDTAGGRMPEQALQQVDRMQGASMFAHPASHLYAAEFPEAKQEKRGPGVTTYEKIDKHTIDKAPAEREEELKKGQRILLDATKKLQEAWRQPAGYVGHVQEDLAHDALSHPRYKMAGDDTAANVMRAYTMAAPATKFGFMGSMAGSAAGMAAGSLLDDGSGGDYAVPGGVIGAGLGGLAGAGIGAAGGRHAANSLINYGDEYSDPNSLGKTTALDRWALRGTKAAMATPFVIGGAGMGGLAGGVLGHHLTGGNPYGTLIGGALGLGAGGVAGGLAGGGLAGKVLEPEHRQPFHESVQSVMEGPLMGLAGAVLAHKAARKMGLGTLAAIPVAAVGYHYASRFGDRERYHDAIRRAEAERRIRDAESDKAKAAGAIQASTPTQPPNAAVPTLKEALEALRTRWTVKEDFVDTAGRYTGMGIGGVAGAHLGNIAGQAIAHNILPGETSEYLGGLAGRVVGGSMGSRLGYHAAAAGMDRLRGTRDGEFVAPARLATVIVPNRVNVVKPPNIAESHVNEAVAALRNMWQRPATRG